MESNNQKLEELLRQMYAQEDLIKDDEQLGQTIDEEWRKFEAQHFPLRKQRSWGWMQIAASIVGVLMLSGIAYAAVQMIRSASNRDAQAQTEETRADMPSRQVAQKEEQDTLQMGPVVFEDKELGNILDEVAAYYQCEVEYQNKDARHIRFYFTWDKSQSLESVIETFNRFERISIQKENKKLIVR